jgi:hypothetical protein
MANTPVRVLVAMMTLKKSEGLSGKKIFENCHFKILVICDIVLYNARDPQPTKSTYYLFRNCIQEYVKEEKENLFEC